MDVYHSKIAAGSRNPTVLLVIWRVPSLNGHETHTNVILQAVNLEYLLHDLKICSPLRPLRSVCSTTGSSL
jgi:hypothetical protein